MEKSLKPSRLAVLEGGDDARLHRQVVEVRQRLVHLGPGDLVVVLVQGLDARRRSAWPGSPTGRVVAMGGGGRRTVARLGADVLPAPVVGDDDPVAARCSSTSAFCTRSPTITVGGLLVREVEHRADGPAWRSADQRSEQLQPQRGPHRLGAHVRLRRLVVGSPAAGSGRLVIPASFGRSSVAGASLADRPSAAAGRGRRGRGGDGRLDEEVDRLRRDERHQRHEAEVDRPEVLPDDEFHARVPGVGPDSCTASGVPAPKGPETAGFPGTFPAHATPPGGVHPPGATKCHAGRPRLRGGTSARPRWMRPP